MSNPTNFSLVDEDDEKEEEHEEGKSAVVGEEQAETKPEVGGKDEYEKQSAAEEGEPEATSSYANIIPVKNLQHGWLKVSGFLMVSSLNNLYHSIKDSIKDTPLTRVFLPLDGGGDCSRQGCRDK